MNRPHKYLARTTITKLIAVGASIFIATFAASSAASAGTFRLLAKGQSLPSDETCKTAVAEDTSEPLPSNSAANHTIPTDSFLASYRISVSSGEGGASAKILQRVDGRFTGTTDAVLKWASCKWGFDEDITRATAVNESHWKQAGVGDVDNGISLGILQIKTRDYPSTCRAVAVSQNPTKVNDPDCYSHNSTAFNADYKLAQQRACFEGEIDYLDERVPVAGYPSYRNGTPDQMMWGCVGWWYSGGWYDSGALTYIGQVQVYLRTKPWLHPELFSTHYFYDILPGGALPRDSTAAFRLDLADLGGH